MVEADFASLEFDPRNENSLRDIYDIITHETPDVAAKRLWDVLQETKDGRRRIRPYTTEEIIRGRKDIITPSVFSRLSPERQEKVLDEMLSAAREAGRRRTMMYKKLAKDAH